MLLSVCRVQVACSIVVVKANCDAGVGLCVGAHFRFYMVQIFHSILKYIGHRIGRFLGTYFRNGVVS
jgi:hypothetical protein